MPRSDSSRRLRLLRPAPLVVLLLASSLTCGDASPTGPGLPGRGALDVAPVFESVQAGGPVLELVKVRARLIGEGRAGKDTTFAEAAFVGDSAVLRFEVTVAAPSQIFTLEVEALDRQGLVLFRGTDTVTVAPGRTAARGAPLLRYAAPDTAVTSLVLAPADTVLEAGTQLQLRAVGLAADESRITTLNLGWTSRDPLAATVLPSGTVVAQALERSTWIVARTFTGVTDSVKVRVRGGVAAVVITPDSAATIVGNTVVMYAEARDAAGSALIGEGREVTWSTLDPQVVALKAISDESQSSTPSTSPTRSAADGSEIPRFARDGSGIPQPPASRTGTSIPRAASTDTAVRTTIGSNGVATTAVVGLAAGFARVVAQVGTRADTALVRVETNAGIVVRTVVRPTADTLTSLGDTLQLLAASYDPNDDLAAGTYTWVARDPLAVSVSALGTAVALAPGKSWIVVEEGGGTTDSALVVVEQRVASVAIAPFVARVTLGHGIEFRASPVDGRGHPLPSSRPVAWSTESQVLAQVDAGGIATGTGVGEETIFASIDGVVGRALLTVVSPVARVVITPDTLTLTALGAAAQWTAVAYDSAGVTIDAPVVWESSNRSVAELTSTQAMSATMVAGANGTTTLRARVHGVEARVPVRVQQSLASILLGPSPLMIGLGGAAQLTPHALDANGAPIAGFPTGGLLWSVETPAIASVDRGFVQGLELGRTAVTVSANGISSAAAVVSVTDSAPAAISFGRDTIAVGFADSADVPIFLSRPNSLVPVDVHLTSSDPAVSVEPALVRFEPSSTSRVVRVRGRAVGTATLSAVDSLTGYAAAYAVIAAQPGASIDPSVVSLNANDELLVRVLLTDPAPAGGVELQFDDGGSGIVSIAPRPVFIPAGHLAAEVTVHGVRGREATVVPVAPGLRGAPATVVVADAALAFTRARSDSGCYQNQCDVLEPAAEATATDASLTSARASLDPIPAALAMSSTSTEDAVLVGAGQYLAGGRRETYFDTGLGVRTPVPMHRPLEVQIHASDPTIVKSDEWLTIARGSATVRLGVGGLRVGEAMLTAKAPGWAEAVQRVIVTTPRLEICCESDRLAGTEDYLSISVTDSMGVQHPRISSLVARVSSSDRSVVTVLDTAPVIAIDASSDWNVRVKAVGAGSAWVRVRAGGHEPDSVLVRVLGGSFQLHATSGSIGAMQRSDASVSISLPASALVDRTFTVTSSAPGTLSVPASVTLPAGGSRVYVPIEGRSPGLATLTVASPDMESRSREIRVTSPRVVILAHGDSVPVNGTLGVGVYTTDSLGTVHTTTERVVVRVRPRDEAILAAEPDSLVIEAGQSSASGALRGLALGSTRVRAQASSHLDDSTGTLRVVASRLRVNDGDSRRTLGAGQRRSGALDYVRIADARSVDVRVRISGARSTQVPDSVTIPSGAFGAEIPVLGVTPGADTLLLIADGYAVDTLFYLVTPPRLLNAQTLPSSIPFGSAPYEVRVRPGDMARHAHATVSGVTVRLRATNPDVLALDSTWIHIPSGASISTPTLARFVGLGSAAVIFEDSAGVWAPDTTGTVLVTAPPLAFGASSTSLGMRQQTDDYDQWVSLPVTATADVTVRLSTSDARVASVPVSVVIPAGQSMASFRITGGDATGTVQLRAQSDGYHPATAAIDVGRPGFALSLSTWMYTVDAPQPVTVWAVDHRGNLRTVTEDIVVGLQSSNTAAATVDSATVTIRAGTRGAGENGSGAAVLPAGVGTTALSASDSRSETWAYRRAESDTIQVRRPEISLGYAELALGVGQYAYDDVWIAGSVDSARTVTLLRSAPAVLDAPDTVQVPMRSSYASIRLTALEPGVDTLIATLPGYVSDTTVVRVGLGTIELHTDGGLPLGSLRVGETVAVRVLVRGPGGEPGKPVAAATSWTLSAGPELALSADAAGTTPLTSIAVAADQTVSAWFHVRAASAGTPTLTATNPNYRTLDRTVRIDP